MENYASERVWKMLSAPNSFIIDRHLFLFLSRAIIFYIFHKKEYLSSGMRIILLHEVCLPMHKKEDSKMALNKVEICGVNTSKLPVLKAEEKEELFRRIKQGDEEARELYIKGNLRLVLSVIKRFSNSSENMDDLFQIGCIGLIKAIDNFDTTLNVKFSTYAVPMIVGEIRRYLRDNNSIRVSRSLRDIAYRAIYAKETYIKTNSKEPTLAEIASEIGIEKEMVVYAMDAIQNPVSLFEPVYTEGGDTLYVMDQISDKKNKEENWLENISLREAMSRLNRRERHIIDLRFYEGKTQMEVAREIGISQAQVSRLEKNALKSMRNYLRA